MRRVQLPIALFAAQDFKILHTLVGMNSAAHAAGVAVPKLPGDLNYLHGINGVLFFH